MITGTRKFSNFTDMHPLWIPALAVGSTWEEIEQKLGIARTGLVNVDHRTCEVAIPVTWEVIYSKYGYFQQHLIDDTGKLRAKLFYKLQGGDTISIVED